MKYADIAADGRVHQVWEDVALPPDKEFSPPLLPGHRLMAFPDESEVRPGMIWDGKALRPPPPPPPEQVNARIVEAAEERIERIADEVYTRSAARAARYTEKYREAQRYRQAGYPPQAAAEDYPYLTAEAGARGVTLRALADAILMAAEAYQRFGALVEAKRAALKMAVAAAPDEASKQAAANAIVAEVEAAAQSLRS